MTPTIIDILRDRTRYAMEPSNFGIGSFSYREGYIKAIEDIMDQLLANQIAHESKNEK